MIVEEMTVGWVVVEGVCGTLLRTSSCSLSSSISIPAVRVKKRVMSNSSTPLN